MPSRRHLAAALAFAFALPLAFVSSTIAPPAASAATADVANGCFWSFDSTDRNLAVTLSGEASPRIAVPGDKVTLDDATITAELQAWLGAYGYTFNILEAGYNEIPATIWVAIEGSNTAEGTQVVEVDVIASTTVTPADPEVPGSTTTATPIKVENLLLPATTWTATGGSIEFRQGKPGTLAGIVPVPEDDPEAEGSVYLAAEFGAFDITFDCRPGTVDIVTPPYPFIPSTSWAAFDTVAVPIETDTNCGPETTTSYWYGSANPSPVVVGDDVTLADGAVAVTVPGSVLSNAYQDGHIGAGEVVIPVEVSGSILGSNPSGAERDFTVSGSLTGLVIDGPGEGTGDATAADAVVDAELAAVTFTPTDVGEITFAPGQDLSLRFGDSGWLDLDCTVAPTVFEQADVLAVPPTEPPPTVPPTTSPAPTTTALPSGGEPDLTPKSGSATYPLTCSYVYDLPGSGPGSASYSLTATGTVPTRVVAGSSVTLSDQTWTVNIPWELRGPLQTGFNVGALKDGDVLVGTAGTTLFASNTVEGTVTSSNIPARLGPVVKGQASSLVFTPPAQTVTAVGGGPVGFEVRAAQFDVTIQAAQFGSVLVSFDCLATAVAGTNIVTTDVVGESDLLAAQDPGDNSAVGVKGKLPATGSGDTRPITGLAVVLVLVGLALVVVPTRIHRHR